MRNIQNTKGFTLVEMIVSFALIGLFAAAAALVMALFAETAVKLNGIHQSQMLSVTLMDTIEGELSEASYIAGGTSVQILDGGQRVTFTNKKGKVLTMACAEGRLLFSYVDGSSWGFGEGVYHDSALTGLYFQKKQENLILVTLDLEDKKTGYHRTKERIVKCYHLKAEQIAG